MKKVLLMIWALGLIGCSSVSQKNANISESGNSVSRDVASSKFPEECGLLLGIQTTVAVLAEELQRNKLETTETFSTKYSAIYHARANYAEKIKTVFVPKIKDPELKIFFNKLAIALGTQFGYSANEEGWKNMSNKVASDLYNIAVVIGEMKHTLSCSL